MVPLTTTKKWFQEKIQKTNDLKNKDGFIESFSFFITKKNSWNFFKQKHACQI